jgi:hypothetical protein
VYILKIEYLIDELMQTKKIFVVGNSRSGTKLLGMCLKLHSQIHTLREIHFFDEIVSSPYEQIKRTTANKLLKKLFTNPKLNIRITDNFNDSEATIIAYELYNHIQQRVLEYRKKAIACDPTPRNLFYAKELKVIYPNAFFIALNRDLRAVLWSQKNKWKLINTTKQQNRFELLRSYINYHPIITSFIWKKSVKEAKILAEELGDSILVIKYEEFIRNPQNTLKKATSRCKVDFEKEMLNIRVTNTSEVSRNEIIGFDKSRIDDWKQKLSKTDIWIAQKMCNIELQEFGYSLVEVYPNVLILIMKLAILPIHGLISFFMNVIKARLILSFLLKKILKYH